MNVRLRVLPLSFLFLCLVCPVSSTHAQRNPNAPTNTDLDYFNPTNDPHIKWLIADQKHHHLDRAVIRIREGDYNRALRELRFLLTGFVNHPHGLALLGVVAKLVKNPSLAVPHYERALKIYSQYAVTHAQYGSYLVDIGYLQAGIAKLKKAVEMNPKLAPAHAWLAKAYSLKGDSEQAKMAAAKARELGYTKPIQLGSSTKK